MRQVNYRRFLMEMPERTSLGQALESPLKQEFAALSSDEKYRLEVDTLKATLIDFIEDAVVYEYQILHQNPLSAVEEFYPSAGYHSVFAGVVIGEGIAVPVR